MRSKAESSVVAGEGRELATRIVDANVYRRSYQQAAWLLSQQFHQLTAETIVIHAQRLIFARPLWPSTLQPLVSTRQPRDAVEGAQPRQRLVQFGVVIQQEHVLLPLLSHPSLDCRLG